MQKNDQWGSMLISNEDVAFEIVADILKDLIAQKNPTRTGRRPKPEAMPFEEVMLALFPQRYSCDEFTVALEKLMHDQKVSQKQLAERIEVNPSTVCRFLSGTRKPTPETIEKIAEEFEVPPHWFVEYRAHIIATVFSDFLASQPERSVDYYKRMLR